MLIYIIVLNITQYIDIHIPSLLFFWEDTQLTVGDNTFLKSLGMWEFFFHELKEHLLKEGSLGTSGAFCLHIFLCKKTLPDVI